jgi:transposase-like protein
MDKLRSNRRAIAPAQRGYIIQRVLVDGWSIRQAAETFDLDERRIANWVAAYRRDGMTSLLRDDIRTEPVHRRAWRGCAAALQRVALWLGLGPRREAASFVVLRRTGQDVRRQR